MDQITHARLIVVPFAIVIWLLTWSMRFIKTPISNPLKRVGVQSFVVAIYVGAIFIQFKAYQSLGGTYIIGKDHVFMGEFFVENIIALYLVLSSAFERDRKNRARQER